MLLLFAVRVVESPPVCERAVDWLVSWTMSCLLFGHSGSTGGFPLFRYFSSVV